MSMRLMIGWVQILPQPGIWTTLSISWTRSALVFRQSSSRWQRADRVRPEGLQLSPLSLWEG